MTMLAKRYQHTESIRNELSFKQNVEAKTSRLEQIRSGVRVVDRRRSTRWSWPSHTRPAPV